MKTSVIRIGNSRGIRIPKTLLEQCRLRDEVEQNSKWSMITWWSVPQRNPEEIGKMPFARCTSEEMTRF